MIAIERRKSNIPRNDIPVTADMNSSSEEIRRPSIRFSRHSSISRDVMDGFAIPASYMKYANHDHEPKQHSGVRTTFSFVSLYGTNRSAVDNSRPLFATVLNSAPGNQSGTYFTVVINEMRHSVFIQTPYTRGKSRPGMYQERPRLLKNESHPPQG